MALQGDELELVLDEMLTRVERDNEIPVATDHSMMQQQSPISHMLADKSTNPPEAICQ